MIDEHYTWNGGWATRWNYDRRFWLAHWEPEAYSHFRCVVDDFGSLVSVQKWSHLGIQSGEQGVMSTGRRPALEAGG